MNKTTIKEIRKRFAPPRGLLRKGESLNGSLPIGKDISLFGKSRWIAPSVNKGDNYAIVGKTGAGKSNILLQWILSQNTSLDHGPGFLIIDPKCALLRDAIGKYNAKKNKLYRVLNPADPQCPSGYQPFHYVNEQNKVASMLLIAAALVPIPHGAKDQFWLLSARVALAAGLLYSYERALPFGSALREIQKTPIRKLMSYVLDYADETNNEDMVLLANDYPDMSDETLTSIAATVKTAVLPLAADSDLQRVLNTTDKDFTIKPEEILRGVDTYLSFPEERLTLYSPLLRLILVQFMGEFAKLPDTTDCKGIILIDEMYRLGRIADLSEYVSTIRSRGFRIAIATQSYASLFTLYGKFEADTMLANMAVIFLGSNSKETRQIISDEIGEYPDVKRTYNYEPGLFFKTMQSVTYGEGVLVNQNELSDLNGHIIFYNEGKAIIAKRINYYEATEFAKYKVKSWNR